MHSKLNENKKRKMLFVLMTFATCMVASTMPVFAQGVNPTQLVQSLVKLIGQIFQIVGAILAAYSVGQLVLAFKNEDADSKSRASTTLVVALVLIALPTILQNLGFTNISVDGLGQ